MLLFMIFFFIIAIYITIYLRFPQFKALKKVKQCNNKKTKQTFYLSLATNLGVGNLIGVSAAIFTGGPGVILWMALFAFFASALSFFENYYAVSSQISNEHGTFAGTCYTIIKYLKGHSKKAISLVFAIFLILSNTLFFPPIQINAIISIIPFNYRLNGSIILIISILLIILGGIKRILKITDRIVPIFSILYCVILLIGIITQYKVISSVFSLIWNSAFNFRCISVSSFFSMFKISISKSIFSNEAGLGTIPSLTGVSDKKEKEVVSYYQLLGVIVDTVILCSLTGIFILCYSDGYNGSVEGLLSYCFKMYLGNIGLVIYKIFITFFGLSSVLGLYYLGENNIMFISLFTKIRFNIVRYVYQFIFIIGISIGIIGTFSSIMWLVDIGIILLGTINLLVLIKIEKSKKMLKNIHKIT